MALGRTGNIILVRNGGTHRVNELYAANTTRVRRMGDGNDRSYEFHNSTVRIDGNATLIIDRPCIFNDDLILKIEVRNGTLQIGEEQTEFGVTAPSQVSPVVVNFRGTNINSPDAWKIPSSSQMRVRNASQVRLLGAYLIFEEGNLAFQNNSLFYCRDSVVFCNGNLTGDAGSPRLLIASPNVDIDGLVMASQIGNLQSMTLTFTPTPGVTNFRPIHCALALQCNLGTDGTEVMLSTAGNAEGVVFSQDGLFDRTIFVESVNGELITGRSKSIGDLGYFTWALVQFVDVKFVVSDVNGSTDALLYVRDTYNGANRRYIYSSLVYVDQIEYSLSVPVSGELTQRLEVAIQDRNLQVLPDPVQPIDPDLDDRRPYVGWIRKFGHFDAAVNINSLVSFEQGYLIVANRAVVLTAAAADAITGVTITFHDTAVSWQGLNWSISIVISGATTASEAWQYVHRQLTKTTVVAGGLTGIQMHNLWPSIRQTDSFQYFDSANQTYRGRGVRVVNPADDAFPGVNAMEADDGSVYSPPLSVTLSFINLVADSELVVKISTMVQYHVVSSGTSEAYIYAYTQDLRADLIVIKEGYEFFTRRDILLGATNQTIRINQVASTAFIAPV